MSERTKLTPEDWSVLSTLDEGAGGALRDELRRAIDKLRDVAREASDPPGDLRHVVCPQCGSGFKLRWGGSDLPLSSPDPCTVIVRDCPSGGVYDVEIQCPHCNYQEPL